MRARAALPPFVLGRVLAATVTLCAAAGVAGCGREAPAARASVLFIGIDTLRADALGAYGSAAARTPTLDALAARGVLFERALAQAPATGPSFSSILTGRYPIEHGVLHSTRPLPAEEHTLAERFQARGYRTAAFVSCSIVASRYGFGQGFELYDEQLESEYEGGHFERGAHHTTEAALRWLGALEPGAPFFAWVHYFDPHAPYVDRDTPGIEAADRRLGSVRVLRALQKDPARRAAALPVIRALYDGEVSHVDGQIARLLAALETLGRADRTLIVVAADHGEELFDHDDFHGHHRQVTQSVLQVPLILAGPGVPSGRRVGEWVENVDVLPTVDALTRSPGDPTLDGVSGRDLRALWSGGAGEPRVARAQREPYANMPGGLAFGAVDGDWKLQWFSRAGPRLYDLASDPLERSDVGAAHPEVVRRLSETLEPWIGRTAALGFADPHALDPQDEELLRSLGYVQ
jgi:arylsulfatase A-like enzyme